jgi:tetratricopeptide (TPR) repeat protein
VLEAVRRGLTGSVGKVLHADEWSAVTTNHARDFPVTPLVELLPELTGDLQLLRAEAADTSATAGWTSPELAVPAAELSVLIALTLTGIGRLRVAERWWRTARAAADSSAEPRVRSLARGWEALSGLSERRPLADLLELTEDALALADRPSCIARALAAGAQILAQLDRAEDAQRALHDLLAVTDDLPVQPVGATSLFDWSEYKTSWVAGLVRVALGETDSAYMALDRALALCPTGSLRERAELELVLARCLVLDGEVAAGLAVAMRVLVELPDQWHSHYLYEAAGRVLSAVQGKDLGRAAVRDYRELLVRRPYHNRSVGSGSSSAWPQG